MSDHFFLNESKCVLFCGKFHRILRSSGGLHIDNTITLLSKSSIHCLPYRIICASFWAGIEIILGLRFNVCPGEKFISDFVLREDSTYQVRNYDGKNSKKNK